MMDSRVYIEHFEKDFYKSVYRRWRLDAEKAAKDIVGEEYVSFRSTIYKQHGFSVVEDKSRKTIGGYDADLAIERDGEIIIVEEAKGHYVDSCFLQRAISSCAIVVAHCISENKEPPHFVLSCPTKMNNYSEVFDRQCALYREDIRHYLKTKFTYLPVCTHGRVGRRKYYANEENCFTLNEELVQQQLSFLEGIKND